MREEVQRLHQQGLGTKAIAMALGVSSPTIVYHKKALGIELQKQDRNVDWLRVQSLLDAGISQREICKLVGIASQTLCRALNSETVKRPEYRYTLNDLILANQGRKCSGTQLKKKIIEELGWEDKCQRCGISEWCGEPITIQVDHINGDPTNHAIDNLRFLCPNCHSQTETWGRKTRTAPCATG